MKLQAGQTFRRYMIVADQLAEGLCGPVYHAVLEHENKRREEVALKFLTNKNPQVGQYFQNEERLLRKTSHDHIARYVHSNMRDAPITLATEFIPAYPHKDLARQRWGALALQIAEEIGAALDYLHHQHPNHPVIHRDVKPDNILLDRRNGRAVLIDLSVASHPQFTLVADHGFGTPPYMAPEQYTGYEVPATDQFALALVVCYFLTGKAMPTVRPPKIRGMDSDDQQIAKAALETWQEQVKPQLARQQQILRRRLSAYPQTSMVLVRAIAYDPDSRYPTCAALASELKAALATDGASLESPEFNRLNSRRSAWISAVGIALLVLIAAAWLIVSGGGGSAPSLETRGAPIDGMPATSTLPGVNVAGLSNDIGLPVATVTLAAEPTITLGPIDDLTPTTTLRPESPGPAGAREIRLKHSEILRVAPGDDSLNVLRTRKLPATERLIIINPTPARVKGDRRPWYQVQRVSDGVKGWIPEGSFE